jgi:ribosomal-protein-alanine acetyltransferase
MAAVKNESTDPGQAPTLPLRDAAPADLDGLVELEAACFDGDRLSRRSFRKLIGSSTAACRVVAAAGGRIVGYALLLFRSGTGLARLYSIAVHPAQRGTGLGVLLLKDSEAVSFDRDRVILRLEVREDNAEAIRLYERHGYRRIGRYLNYYADRTAALRFEKRLRGASTPPPTVP